MVEMIMKGLHGVSLAAEPGQGMSWERHFSCPGAKAALAEKRQWRQSNEWVEQKLSQQVHSAIKYLVDHRVPLAVGHIGERLGRNRQYYHDLLKLRHVTKRDLEMVAALFDLTLNQLLTIEQCFSNHKKTIEEAVEKNGLCPLPRTRLDFRKHDS